MRKIKTAEEKSYKKRMTELWIELIAAIMLAIGVVILLAYGFQQMKKTELERNLYADYPSSAIIRILEK